MNKTMIKKRRRRTFDNESGAYAMTLIINLLQLSNTMLLKETSDEILKVEGIRVGFSSSWVFVYIHATSTVLSLLGRQVLQWDNYSANLPQLQWILNNLAEI